MQPHLILGLMSLTCTPLFPHMLMDSGRKVTWGAITGTILV